MAYRLDGQMLVLWLILQLVASALVFLENAADKKIQDTDDIQPSRFRMAAISNKHIIKSTCLKYVGANQSRECFRPLTIPSRWSLLGGRFTADVTAAAV